MSGDERLLSQRPADGTGPDGQTRAAVVSLLVDEGPMTANDIADHLGISTAGVRRHLDNLQSDGDIEVAPAGFSKSGKATRGRPAKWFQLTPKGRGKLRHAYDDLAGAVIRKLRDVAGQQAVEEFAQERIDGITEDVVPVAESGSVIATVNQITDALTAGGYAANIREVGAGLQICQHHCPVAHVAAEFPELCEAETARFTELLGTHVQRLATIANGDCVCTTHVPVHVMTDGGRQPATSDTPDGKVPR
ncbi:helix-turn-helix transcriptional regulator [Gordonia phthalatica]|uniref:ArsR family transcriptional regulator n=1 Tax=Gordonia phthalatica TaxID=1136941 RepID=A0A0N9MPR3_9ACTN|nr:metalloregulator ArsR/SmtB family transcription factor [Gordonia phthalatica]ALG84792.1 ArsR family transcriptional regulator [Gordonia phthalatica]